MVPVAEDRAAWASHDLVQLLGGANAERLHHAGERRNPARLDEHVDVVPLHGEIGEARIAPLQAQVERALEHPETPTAAKVPHLGPHAHGDMERLARIDLARHVRHAGGALPGPGLLPARPSGGLESKVELAAFHHSHDNISADIVKHNSDSPELRVGQIGGRSSYASRTGSWPGRLSAGTESSIPEQQR